MRDPPRSQNVAILIWLILSIHFAHCKHAAVEFESSYALVNSSFVGGIYALAKLVIHDISDVILEVAVVSAESQRI